MPFFDLGRVGTPAPGAGEIARLRTDPPDLLVIDGAEALARSQGRYLADALPELTADGTALVLALPDADVRGILA
ncbi:hypothetical protein KC221_30170, partial [Mycobacterium tuberculosis]|nr:hypothetical protein [Mycobacterium tuberculosis]